MNFLKTGRRAKDYLQEAGRVSLRALKLELQLDDDQLEARVEPQHGVSVQARLGIRTSPRVVGAGAACLLALIGDAQLTVGQLAKAHAERWRKLATSADWSVFSEWEMRDE